MILVFMVGVVLFGLGIVMVYLMLLVVIGDVVWLSWCVFVVGIYCLWWDLGYVVGVLLVGIVVDVFGLYVVVYLIVVLMFVLGVFVVVCM